MIVLSELPPSLVEKVIKKMKQARAIALYRCSHWGKQVVEEHRRCVLDNYGLLINLVKKMESPLSTERERLVSSRKFSQIAGYMRRTLTTETPERRSSHQRRVHFGQMAQLEGEKHEIGKENIGNDLRITKCYDRPVIPLSNKL